MAATTTEHRLKDRTAHRGVTFASRAFAVAGVYGILALAPQYFMEGKLGRDYPPPITHPEHFYGFVGLALVWQVLFLMIAKDPIRYRPVMPVAILEKLSWGLPCIILYAQGRLAPAILAVGLIDLALGVLFALCYRATAPAAR